MPPQVPAPEAARPVAEPAEGGDREPRTPVRAGALPSAAPPPVPGRTRRVGHLPLRRADVAAALAGVAALAYTVFAVLGASGGGPLPSSDAAPVGVSIHAEGVPARAATTSSADADRTGGTSAPGGAPAGPGTRPAAPVGQVHGTGVTSTVASGVARSGTGGDGTPGGPPAQDAGNRASARAPGATTPAPVLPPVTTTSVAATRVTVPATPTTAPTRDTTTTRATTTTRTTTTTHTSTATQSTLDVPGVWVPCSKASIQGLIVTFHNTTSTSRRLAWVSTGCQLVPGALVAPGGGTVTVVTFVGNSWAFLDPATGRPVGATVMYAGQRDAWMW